MVERDEMLESSGVDRMQLTLKKLSERCPCCWVTDGWKRSDHSFSSCSKLNLGLGTKYDLVRSKLKYWENRVCYVYSVPRDWCVNYRVGDVCELQDSVIPVCLTGWGVESLQRVIKEVAGRGFGRRDEYMEWLGRGCRVNDVRERMH